MEILLSIIYIAVGFVGLFFIIMGQENESSNCSFFGVLLTVIGFSIFGLTIGHKMYKSEGPTALDVYRNKTTLKVTYEDNIATDSVVVFKKK